MRRRVGNRKFVLRSYKWYCGWSSVWVAIDLPYAHWVDILLARRGDNGAINGKFGGGVGKCCGGFDELLDDNDDIEIDTDGDDGGGLD